MMHCMVFQIHLKVLKVFQGARMSHLVWVVWQCESDQAMKFDSWEARETVLSTV
jgi:hypothetical protein